MGRQCTVLIMTYSFHLGSNRARTQPLVALLIRESYSNQLQAESWRTC
jgi:hypothetical protein